MSTPDSLHGFSKSLAATAVGSRNLFSKSIRARRANGMSAWNFGRISLDRGMETDAGYHDVQVTGDGPFLDGGSAFAVDQQPISSPPL
jgi:hypothetical protein